MGMTQLFVSPAKPFPGLLPGLRTRKRTLFTTKKKERRTVDTLTVGGLMDSLKPVPKRSLLLGKCVDGLPFLIELGDPGLGAVLVACDPGFGKTHQLQVMVDSALRTHSPHELQVGILSVNPEEWAGLGSKSGKTKFVQGRYAWYDDRAVAMIASLTELAESRLEGEQKGADILLILDDITAVEDLSMEAQVNLRWLLEYGPQSAVWIVGALDAPETSRMQYWVETFRTRIIGRVVSPVDLDGLVLQADTPQEKLDAGEFQVWTGDMWLRYRLPLLGDMKALEA